MKPAQKNITVADFIIPAIDIIDGKAVRLTQGDYAQQKVYNTDPVEVAKIFEAAGLKRLHVVDLDGAKAGKIQHLDLLEKMAGSTNLEIDFGGGVKTLSDLRAVFNAGATMATIGSLAVKHPELLQEWIAHFGTDKFFIGADVYEENIKISGWIEDGGINIFHFLEKMNGIGAKHFFCTDIKMDGALRGSSIDLYKKIMQRYPATQLTASGGVSGIADILAAKEAGCSGVIIGKAIYEGLISLQELQQLNTRLS